MNKYTRMDKCFSIIRGGSSVVYNTKTKDKEHIVGYRYDRRNPLTSCMITLNMNEVSLFEFVDRYKPISRVSL